MATWAVIPAFNEGKRIKEVLRKTKKFTPNVIVVDDGSKDETSSVAKEEKVVLLPHITNLGKGAALKTGCDYALMQGADKIVVLDADGQHDPERIPDFLRSLEEADIVFGYRQLGESMPYILRFGNWFINKMVAKLYGLELRDTQSGYRAFTADAYKKIRWNARDYSMESEMISRVGRHKLKYTEVPIKTIYGDKYKGTTVIDGIRIVTKLMMWRVS